MNSVPNRHTQTDPLPPCEALSVALEHRLAELERSNEDLHREKQAAEAASQAKSELLANISHELRTPVTAMLGMLKLALRTPLNEEQEEYLGLMQGAGDSLMALINCVLDYSRIEAGPLQVEKIPFSLRHCINSTLEMLGIGARQKGLTLACNIAPEIPDALLGDPLRLRQVLVNLVGNAIKFTSHGEIRLRVERQAEGEREVCFHFSVHDNGIGIAKEQQAHIFEPYYQAEASTCRVYGGSGLGLSICAQLIGMMNGKIWLDSAPGCGSTFHFTARFERETPGQGAIAPRQPKCQANKYSILLVEDDPTNRRLAQLQLEQAGHRVLLADSGATALATLRHSCCDLVLMDLQMPGMDGLQTATAIRQQEAHKGGRLPIIALTAHAQPQDQARCLQAGIDACLTKPIDPTRLDAIIDGLPHPTPLPCRHSKLVLNRAALLVRVHGDMHLLDEIRQLFLRDYGGLMADIRIALAAQDVARSKRPLHTLLGMLRSLAAEAAQGLVIQLEKQCHAEDWKRADVIYARLEVQLDALQDALSSLALTRPQLIPKTMSVRRHSASKCPLPANKTWTGSSKHPVPNARFESARRKGMGI